MKEFKSLNGFLVKDETARNEIEKINSENYYDEVVYEQERHYETDCYFTYIPVQDKNGNPIKVYVSDTGKDSPLEHAIKNHTTLTINASVPYKLDGLFTDGSVIANGEIIRDIDFSDTDIPETFLYVGIKEDRTIVDYVVKYTTPQMMVADGVKEAFMCYYKLVESGEVVNNEETIGNQEGIATDSHPRQCIGVNESGTIIILTCDGRTDINKGLTSAECSQLLKNKGCVEAYNLDGGGSTSTIIRESKLNRNVDNNGTEDRASIVYALNVKKEVVNENIAEVFSKIGEEKQNIIKQIIPYINEISNQTNSDLTNKDLDTLIGKVYIGYGNMLGNCPSVTGGYFFNIPHSDNANKDKYNKQFFFERETNLIYTRLMSNGVFTEWKLVDNDCMARAGKNNQQTIGVEGEYTPVIFDGSVLVSDSDIFEFSSDKTKFTVKGDGNYLVDISTSVIFNCKAEGEKWIAITKNGSEDITKASSYGVANHNLSLSITPYLTKLIKGDTIEVKVFGSATDIVNMSHLNISGKRVDKFE